MSLTEIAPAVWTTTAAIWSTTTTVVVAPDGSCLVVDPAITVADLHSLAAEIAGRGWTPVAGFATHPHWDHMLWCEALGNVRRWATSAAVRVAVERRPQILAETEADAPGHDHRLTAVLTPLLGDAGRVPWDGPRALVVPHRAHCPGSAALVLPESGVLVAGDLLSDTEVPLLDLDARDPVGDHSEALIRIERAADRHGVSVVVPGHGTVTDRTGMLARTAADRRYLDALVGAGPMDDERLGDPWVASEHERQVLWANAL